LKARNRNKPAENRPISDGSGRAEKPHVFRHAVRVPDSHTFSRNAASSCVIAQTALKSASENERFLIYFAALLNPSFDETKRAQQPAFARFALT
jgi:hypothetical protein